MRNINKVLAGVCMMASFMLPSCSDDDVVAPASFNEVNNLVSFDASHSPKSLLVIPDTNAVFKITGLGAEDRLQLHSQSSDKYMDLSWGQYCSEDNLDSLGNYIYDPTTIIVALKENKAWEAGKMNLIVRRGLEQQMLGEINVSPLILDDSHIDVSSCFNGIIDSIYARGWQSDEIDSVVIKNVSSGKSFVLKTPATPSTTINDKVLFSFQSAMPGMESGNYEMLLRRWKYDFMQKICSFSFYKYDIKDTESIKADAEGNFKIHVSVDNIAEGDYFRVIYGSGKTAVFRHDLVAENFDAASQTYTITIPSDKVRAYNYNVHYYRNGVDVNLGSIEVVPNS